MQSKIRLMLGAGFVALLGLGAVAGIAHADRGPGGFGHHGRGGGMFAHMAERYDTNKDGKVSQEEIDANRADWYGRFDADKDSAMTLKEFEALWLEANRQRMVREFQRFDKDGDAKLTLDEYKAPLASIVADMDRNGDNVLSKDDRRRRGKDRRENSPPPPPAEQQ